MADTETTAVHTAEVVRYDDPVIITERVAVAAFIAGYTDPIRRSYATDLRIFAAWCHDHGINLLNVKRPHLEKRGTSGGWNKKAVWRPRSDAGCRRCHRSTSTARPKTSSTRTPHSTFAVRRFTTNHAPSAWTATKSAPSSFRRHRRPVHRARAPHLGDRA